MAAIAVAGGMTTTAMTATIAAAGIATVDGIPGAIANIAGPARAAANMAGARRAAGAGGTTAAATAIGTEPRIENVRESGRLGRFPLVARTVLANFPYGVSYIER